MLKDKEIKMLKGSLLNQAQGEKSAIVIFNYVILVQTVLCLIHIRDLKSIIRKKASPDSPLLILRDSKVAREGGAISSLA